MAASFHFDSLGKIKEPSAEEWQAADNDSAIVALSVGLQADGTPYYAYIAIKPSRYAEFYRLSKARSPLNLEDYGPIIVAGPEASPPEEVTQKMVTEYGFDAHFEEKLEAEFNKERSQFASASEDKRLTDIVAMMKNKKP